MTVCFYQHDISNLEIRRVVQVLNSNWINTGPESQKFEQELKSFLNPSEVILGSSAWAGLFLTLKAWGIKEKDEVITTPYTFAATANSIVQNNARVIFADITPNYLIDPQKIAQKITSRTKAIITMDYGGFPCDYPQIHQLVRNLRKKFKPNNLEQEKLGRILILGDGAHSFGTRPINPQWQYLPDIYVYSFHTVKNITTGDGGAIAIFNNRLTKAKPLINNLRSWGVHGMTKNAYQRQKQKDMFYDIITPGVKTNLTDINAAIGRMQLKRLNSFYQKKIKIAKNYNQVFQANKHYQSKNNYKNLNYKIFPHLYTLELSRKKNSLTAKKKFLLTMRDKGIELNMHYLPLPLTTFYRKLGYTITDYPNTQKIANRHFSLPFYTKLNKNKVQQVKKILLDHFK